MFRFANFEVSDDCRQLLRDGQALVLRERACEVLLALIENAGQVVSKRELCRRAWPERDVDENNLQVEILGLRKLLGKNAIVTAPGRGYQFALRIEADPPVVAANDEPVLLGCSQDIQALEALLTPGVLVTLTGDGGIGKTLMATTLAARREADAPGSTCVVALDAASNDEPPWRLIAATLNLPVEARFESAQTCAAALRGRRLLLVVDGCEPDVQRVAELAAAMLNACPAVSLLATSREVLRLPGERIYRLGPLGLDADAAAPGAGDGDALRLFRRHLSANVVAPAWSNAVRVTVREICRQLEGNPLAIKLAALRAGELGVDALLRRLGERLELLQNPDPLAPARQQSLRASLAWSHALLTALEQQVFGELALLPRPFTLEQLLALTDRSALDPWAAMEALTRLADKSLVDIDRADPPNYRLSETAILFAREMRNAGHSGTKSGKGRKKISL